MHLVYKGNPKKTKIYKADSALKCQGLQLSANVIFMFVLQQLVNIDICAAKCKKPEKYDALG